MPILDTVLGKPLTVWQGEEEKIGVASGVPILGLDGLSSAAYGPEAALTILIPLGALGVRAITPITALILVLLAISISRTARRSRRIRTAAARTWSRRRTSGHRPGSSRPQPSSSTTS